MYCFCQARRGLEPLLKDLQSFTLPLCYLAIFLRGKGFEPLQVVLPPPQDDVSTNSTTPASLEKIQIKVLNSAFLCNLAAPMRKLCYIFYF